MAIGNVSIQTAGGANTLGLIPASGFGFSFLNPLYRYANLTLPYSPNDPGLSYTYNNSTLAPVVLLYARFFNLLNESSVPLIANVGTTAFAVTGSTISGNISCLDVRSFGAVGDGVTDDTAAVQAALNKAYQNFLGNQQIAGQQGIPAQMAQSTAGVVANGSSSTLLLTLPVPPTLSGTMILEFSAFNYGSGPGSPATPIVTDNRGNTWSQASVVANGELLLYTYYAQVKSALSTTVTISIAQRNFNSYIAGVLEEMTGILVPVLVDAVNSVIVPVGNFQAPSLGPTNQPDLVIYSTALSLANGVTPVPPGDFTLLGSQATYQPNGLNGAIPVLAVAGQNWSGTTGINTGAGAIGENWTATGYDGVASMVAFRRIAAAPAKPGITTVCIPSGVSCMLSPQKLFDHKYPGTPWPSQTQGGNTYYASMAYSLVMFDGITLEIDGSVVANPNASSLSISGNLNSGGEFGWVLFTNSAWLLNSTLGTQLVQPVIANSLVSIIPWNSYLAGTAFNEGPRNRGFRITGSGKVYLNGQIQANLPTDIFDNVTPCGFPQMGLARFYCADDSEVSNLEILNPWSLVIEWGHSDRVLITNLYMHDAPNIPNVEVVPTFSLAGNGLIEMDMLRNSKITNNKSLNCPQCTGVNDWAGYQNLIAGNTWTNCYSGYQYIDMGLEWPWIFGPPIIGGVPQPSYKGQTYGNVTHNSEITQNTASNCVTQPSNVSTQHQSGNPFAITTDDGSDGFGFEVGAWYTIGFPPSEVLPVTGTGFHDNIANGNSTNVFYGSLEAFKSNLNNGTGGQPVTNGINTVTNETPSGVIDGSNKIFTFAHIPQAGSLVLLLNGLTEASGSDYLLNGNQITMIVAPNPGSTLTGSYTYLSGN